MSLSSSISNESNKNYSSFFTRSLKSLLILAIIAFIFAGCIAIGAAAHQTNTLEFLNVLIQNRTFQIGTALGSGIIIGYLFRTIVNKNDSSNLNESESDEELFHYYDNPASGDL